MFLKPEAMEMTIVNSWFESIVNRVVSIVLQLKGIGVFWSEIPRGHRR
jgi:hypothetical protein